MEKPSSTNKAFGGQLQRARKAAKMTQEELAFRAELDRTYISLLERGLKSPTLTTFFRLCRVLDQQPDVFIARVYEQIQRIEQTQIQKQDVE